MRRTLLAICSLGLIAGWPPPNALALTVDTSNRAAVIQFYNEAYLPTQGIAHGWTGSIAGCVPGTLGSAYLNAAVQRLNYFRAHVGLTTDLVFDPAKHSPCQQAALMMAANGALSHSPPSTWLCYTTAGASVAALSGLAANSASLADAVDLMIQSPSVSHVGHRRWLLYRRLANPGAGAVPTGGFKAYVLHVVGTTTPPPATPEWTSWPPPGYLPYALVPQAWSFTYPNANFSSATVTVMRGATALTVTPQAVQSGYGDNTLVWYVAGFPLASAPAPEHPYDVTVSNVIVSGSPRTFSYRVTPIDPSVTVSVAESEKRPDITLLGPRPTPLDGRGTLGFRLASEATVELTLRDAAGRRVASLAHGRFAAGEHHVTWLGLDDVGARVPPGVYFAVLQAAGSRVVRRVPVLR